MLNLLNPLDEENTDNYLSTTIQALKANNDLCDLLADGSNSIYHLRSPNAGSYPILIVSNISDVPEVQSDNSETLHKITIRIHIITEDGATTSIYKLIDKQMKELMYDRKFMHEFWEDELFIKVVDYTILLDISKLDN